MVLSRGKTCSFRFADGSALALYPRGGKTRKEHVPWFGLYGY